VMTSHLMMAIRDIHDVGGVTGRLALVVNEGVGGYVEVQVNALIFGIVALSLVRYLEKAEVCSGPQAVMLLIFVTLICLYIVSYRIVHLSLYSSLCIKLSMYYTLF